MVKQFRPLIPDICSGCDGSIEVYTGNDMLICMPEHCLPGDMVRCTRCQCQGWISQDQDGAYVYWPHDICAACHRFYDAKIERFTAALLESLRARIA